LLRIAQKLSESIEFKNILKSSQQNPFIQAKEKVEDIDFLFNLFQKFIRTTNRVYYEREDSSIIDTEINLIEAYFKKK
jgi:hypothetical protein